MSTIESKFEEEMNQLITKGDELAMALQLDNFGDEFEKRVIETFGAEKGESYLKKLPNFKTEYQSWYSEAQRVIKQVLPDRYKDFISYYEYPRLRKSMNSENYRIRDYLQGLQSSLGYEIIVDGKSAIPSFSQQVSILKAAKETLGSSLRDITSILQADLFDSEVESASALLKSGFLRAAGAICGVVIEKHLKKVCGDHDIKVRKKNPGISDLNQLLKDGDIISVPQWRFNQHLADIRNISDHAKEKEPTKEEIQDLVDGTNKVLKTIY